ncbi:MAG TPA: pitrilysin family protein [Longimicrobiaceae bacterium]|nr:pitrilysin family protein [Longimicrobiaceae bacterium]
MLQPIRTGRLLTALFALAAAAPAAAQQRPAVDIPFEKYTLENGLEVILAPDRTLPAVAVDLWYDVGSRNERQGRTGFAHLFEHMMFEGSQNVGRGEHLSLLLAAGAGNLNGTTNEDRTNYYQVVPPHRLNLALWLEADRLRSLNVTAEQLRVQQEAVKEEKRMRVDNVPYVSSLYHARYTGPYAPSCFPYAHTIIGSMDDLNAATLADVQEFFKTYYAPNNAVLSIAGDFEPAQAKQLVQEYFGDIPRGQTAPGVECAEPFSHLPARDTVSDSNAALPAFQSVYGTVEAGHPDAYALQLLGSILGNGESSRIQQRLVRGEKAAQTAFAGAVSRRGPGLFATFAIANQGVTAERLEQLMDEEVAKVRERGVTAAELERAKNQYRAQAIRTLQSAIGRAEALNRYEVFMGDASHIRTDLDKYMAVTREDVQRVARKYLDPQNRLVVVTVPGRTASR